MESFVDIIKDILISNVYSEGQKERALEAIAAAKIAHTEALAKVQKELHAEAYSAGWNDGYEAGYNEGIGEGWISCQTQAARKQRRRHHKKNSQ